jgi:hypothetical protein
VSFRQEMQPEVGQTVLVRVTVGPNIIGQWSSASHRGVALTVEAGRVYIPWEKVVGMRWWFVTPEPLPTEEHEVVDLTAQLEGMLAEERHRAEEREVARWRALSTELAAFVGELKDRGKETKATGISNGQVVTEAYTGLADEIAARFLGEEWRDMADV